jgi:hypothetical protein
VKMEHGHHGHQMITCWALLVIRPRHIRNRYLHSFWFVPVDWCIKWHNSSHSSRSFGSILSNGMSNLAPAISSKLGDYEQLTGNDRGKFTQLAYLLRLKATRAESLWNPTASLQRLQSLNLPSCPVPSRCR